MTDRDLQKRQAEVERLLGKPCIRCEPVAYGADPHSRVLRVFLREGDAERQVICKHFLNREAYLSELRKFRFVDGWLDFVPALLADDEDARLLVMEYMDGGTLYDLPKSADIEPTAREAVRVLARLHCAGISRIDEFGELHAGNSRRVCIIEQDSLESAWETGIRGAAGGGEIPRPDRELDAIRRELQGLRKRYETIILFDVNPFNFIWTGKAIKIVDIGALTTGPAFADLDILKRLCLKEEKILEIQDAYLDFRKELGAPVGEPSEFLKGTDYWSLTDALMASAWCQRALEGKEKIKATLPEELCHFESLRDDILADVWTISRRRTELRKIATIMQESLPPEICQPRWKRRAGT